MRNKIFFFAVFSFIYLSIYAQKETLLPISAIQSDESFLLIPETRGYPIQFNDSIRKSWLEYSNKKAFRMDVFQNEFYVFQIAAIALKEDVKTLQIKFHPLQGKKKTLNASLFTCFNTEGIDFRGKPFSKNITIPKGKLQALWIGVRLNGERELYDTEIEVIFNGKTSKKIPVEFRMLPSAYLDGGVSNTNTLSKLKWLNDTSGIDNNVTDGFMPISLKNNTLKILGREIELNSNGLPKQIKSYFTGANDKISEQAQNLLASPFVFKIILNNGQEVKLQAGKIAYLKQNDSRIEWQCTSHSPEITLICNAASEFDGYSKFNMKVIGKKSTEIKDIRLDFEMPDHEAEYAMGMNHKGGYRPQIIDWKWNVAKMNQDAIWLGNMNGGIRLKLMDEQYHTPLINIYYEFGPLKLPLSWGNNGNGGFRLASENGVVKASAYSGFRKIKARDTLNFDFELLVTPLKRFDKEKLFGDRYSHPKTANMKTLEGCITDIKKVGSNIANIHHANDYYPFINYPFNEVNVDTLQRLIQLAHAENIRIKPYYTTREITVNLPEFWAFRSLNGEILFPGPGNETKTVLHEKPDQWMIDNLRDNYLQAWVADFKTGRFQGFRDLSVLTTPDSRLNNFYIGGLDWMCKNMEIDGVYIDDCALERTTIRRARKVIDKYRPAGRMDLHSWNHFCPEGSWANCLNLYMNLLPYFDLLWIGEGRDYNEMPDHWLVEICGIPYGVCGQMLQGGGNPWRGMIYGITNRAFWAKQGPEHIWKFWDEYHIKDKEFIGYWDERNPVNTGSDSVKATLYKGPKQSIISIASWANNNIPVTLDIDWTSMGMTPERVKIYAPAIENFQSAQAFQVNKPIEIEKGKGFLLIFETM